MATTTRSSWGCATRFATLEMDTLRHVHLETHVLMPRFERAAASGGREVTP